MEVFCGNNNKVDTFENYLAVYKKIKNKIKNYWQCSVLKTNQDRFLFFVFDNHTKKNKNIFLKILGNSENRFSKHKNIVLEKYWKYFVATITR